jgi:uncharacterized protein YndB with AHSA1/START domain
MSVISVEKNLDDLSVTLTAHFEAPIDQVWELWSNPRKLERWWGPPGYPATFEEHDLSPGGEVSYGMTGPDGAEHRGMWQVSAVDSPATLEFADVHIDSDGAPVPDLPVVRVRVRLSKREGGTRMEMRSEFDSREDLEKWLGTGTLEGLRQAVAQMDALLTT